MLKVTDRHTVVDKDWGHSKVKTNTISIWFLSLYLFKSNLTIIAHTMISHKTHFKQVFGGKCLCSVTSFIMFD